MCTNAARQGYSIETTCRDSKVAASYASSRTRSQSFVLSLYSDVRSKFNIQKWRSERGKGEGERKGEGGTVKDLPAAKVAFDGWMGQRLPPIIGNIILSSSTVQYCMYAFITQRVGGVLREKQNTVNKKRLLNAQPNRRRDEAALRQASEVRGEQHEASA